MTKGGNGNDAPRLRVVPPGGVEEESLADDALVEAFVGGDDAAFARLVRRHEQLVLRIVRRYARDREDALRPLPAHLRPRLPGGPRGLPRAGPRSTSLPALARPDRGQPRAQPRPRRRPAGRAGRSWRGRGLRPGPAPLERDARGGADRAVPARPPRAPAPPARGDGPAARRRAAVRGDRRRARHHRERRQGQLLPRREAAPGARPRRKRKWRRCHGRATSSTP